MFCVFVYIGCNKRGQTSCPVIKTQIQTTCNFRANVSNCNCFLGSLHCRNDNVVLE